MINSNYLDENNIKISRSFSLFTKIFKILLALILCYLYFSNNELLKDFLVIGFVLALILPLSFFDIFIQKLLEYNTQKLEERQLLNANEANQTFTDFQEKIDKLELKIEILTNKIEN